MRDSSNATRQLGETPIAKRSKNSDTQNQDGKVLRSLNNQK